MFNAQQNFNPEKGVWMANIFDIQMYQNSCPEVRDDSTSIFDKKINTHKRKGAERKRRPKGITGKGKDTIRRPRLLIKSGQPELVSCC
jgi:hypothetical protein